MLFPLVPREVSRVLPLIAVAAVLHLVTVQIWPIARRRGEKRRVWRMPVRRGPVRGPREWKAEPESGPDFGADAEIPPRECRGGSVIDILRRASTLR